MDNRKRRVFICMSIISLMGVALLAASLTTEYWVVARPRKRIDEDTEQSAINVTDGDMDTKFKGYIHFGLFRGHKTLDHGLGPREDDINSLQFAGDLFNFELWLSIIVFDFLAAILGIVAAVASILNASTRPVEFLTGPAGVYISNGLYTIFCLVVIVLTITLYLLDLRHNVLTAGDRSVYRWTSTDSVQLHFSFYCVIGASMLGGVNAGVMTLSRVVGCRRSDERQKPPEGLMMY